MSNRVERGSLNICEVSHKWEMLEDKNDPDFLHLLRYALRHSLFERHKNGEEVIGGLALEDVTRGKVGLVHFMKTGLLGTVITNFRSHIPKALRFAVPEAFEPSKQALEKPELPKITKVGPKKQEFTAAVLVDEDELEAELEEKEDVHITVDEEELLKTEEEVEKLLAGWDTTEVGEKGSETTEIVRLFLIEAKKNPLLTKKQEQILFKYHDREKGLEGEGIKVNHRNTKAVLDELIQDPKFQDTITSENSAKWVHVLRNSRSVHDLIMNCNLRLLPSVAGKYKRGHMADKINDGSVGLDKAVEMFDVSRGFRFSTYAYWWVRQSITREIATKGREIRLPVHMQEFLTHADGLISFFESKADRQPSFEEMKDILILGSNISASSINIIIRLKKIGILAPMSINQELNDEDFDLESTLSDESENVGEEGLELEFSNNLGMELEEVLQELKPQGRQVLRYRFGLNGSEKFDTLQEIGDFLGITREGVRQIELKALLELRKSSKARTINRNYSEDIGSFRTYSSSAEATIDSDDCRFNIARMALSKEEVIEKLNLETLRILDYFQAADINVSSELSYANIKVNQINKAFKIALTALRSQSDKTLVVDGVVINLDGVLEAQKVGRSLKRKNKEVFKKRMLTN